MYGCMYVCISPTFSFVNILHMCMYVCMYLCMCYMWECFLFFSRCGRSYCYCALVVNNEINPRKKKLIRNAVTKRKATEKERWRVKEKKRTDLFVHATQNILTRKKGMLA